MRLASTVLAASLLAAAAAPAMAEQTARAGDDGLAACNDLGDRPTTDQLRGCAAAARAFVRAHRAEIADARREIEANRAAIEQAAQTIRVNRAAIEQAAQQIRDNAAALRAAGEALRSAERFGGEDTTGPSSSAPTTPPAP